MSTSQTTHSLTPPNPWDEASDAHQSVRDDSTRAVSWGQLAPDDDALHLSGDIAGLRILDAGCGGGQNSVAMALQGAIVTGVDASDRQLEHARTQALAAGVEVDFLHADLATLDSTSLQPFDLVLAVQVLQYIADAGAALLALSALLKPHGRLILTLDHPTRDLFFDQEEQTLGILPVADYHTTHTAHWRFEGSDAIMTTWHRTIGEWVALITSCGLTLTQLLEPPVPADLLDQLWQEDDALAPLRLIPHTLILVAEKK